MTTTPPKKNEHLEKHYSFDSMGEKFVIPAGLTTKQAIEVLQRKDKQDELEVGIDEVLDGFPADAAYAFQRAMAEKFGWTDLVPSWFNPPEMVGVEVDVGKWVQVAMGQFAVPGIDGVLATQLDIHDGMSRLKIQGAIKQRDKNKVMEVIALAREFLRNESIYRGKAVRLNFPKEGSHPRVIIKAAPVFIDTSKTDPAALVFPKDVDDMVKAALFTPIEYTEACRKNKVPLRRGVLLEGPYGVGKTLTANVAAKKCVENGWTFVYVENLYDLPRAVRFAKKYEPAVIFAEDLDRVVGEERDDYANEVINTIDGIDSKDREMIVVLTTNEVESIHQAMLRPGRIDVIIPVRPPDVGAVVRLLRLYGGDLIDATESLLGAARELEGQIPATIREAVERAKLHAVYRTQGSPFMLASEDLERAAKGMVAHIELLKPKLEDDRSNREKAADVLGGYVAQAAGEFVRLATGAKPMQNGNGHAQLESGDEVA